jgi:hypothetical protein
MRARPAKEVRLFGVQAASSRAADVFTSGEGASTMESKVLTSVGKVAGLGGIALGVVLLIFQGVLKTQFLPQAGLGSDQAYAVILSLMILTFGIAGIGVIAWIVGRAVGPKLPASGAALGVLSGLIVIVVGAAVYVGAQAKPDRVAAPKVEGTSGGMAVGRDVSNSTITIGPGGDRAAK